MDVNSVMVGQPWPTRIQTRLQKASVVLAVIGPGWLTAADKFGRRKLDAPTDWVREDLSVALSDCIPIIPLVFDDLKNVPDPEGLPVVLQARSVQNMRRHAAAR